VDGVTVLSFSLENIILRDLEEIKDFFADLLAMKVALGTKYQLFRVNNVL